jgi:hypothetical protein
MKLKPKYSIAEHFDDIVEGKSNEITALPELIKILDLVGCIVTIDALGCQRFAHAFVPRRFADARSSGVPTD